MAESGPLPGWELRHFAGRGVDWDSNHGLAGDPRRHPTDFRSSRSGWFRHRIGPGVVSQWLPHEGADWQGTTEGHEQALVAVRQFILCYGIAFFRMDAR
jgi:hypothetical protein